MDIRAWLFRRRWTILTIWIAIFSVSVILSYRANEERIHDVEQINAQIQESRVLSCRQTYESFIKVFHPFFPPPSKRTGEQEENLAKLTSIVRGLKARCADQTGVNGD